MLSKRHKPLGVVAKLRQVELLLGQGKTVADAVRAIGVTQMTYGRWRQEYGGLKLDQVIGLGDRPAGLAVIDRRNDPLAQAQGISVCPPCGPPLQPESWIIFASPRESPDSVSVDRTLAN